MSSRSSRLNSQTPILISLFRCFRSEPEGDVVDQTSVAPSTAPRDSNIELDLPSVSTTANVVADEGTVPHIDTEVMVASSLEIPETASDEVKAVTLDGETHEDYHSESGPTDAPEGKVDRLESRFSDEPWRRLPTS